MKRVVTGVNADGKSCVVSNEEVDQGAFVHSLWEFEPADLQPILAGIPEGVAAEAFEPRPGGARLMLVTIAPASEVVEHPPIQGIDEGGWHVTRTLDFAYVIAGELTLLLDEETVVLQAGDVLVLQASRHATRNEGDTPTVLLVVNITPA